MANLKESKLGQRAEQYLGFCIKQWKIWAFHDKVATLRSPPTPMKNSTS